MTPDRFEKLIASIGSDKYNQKELINLYNNASKSSSITEDQRELIVSEIEKATRLRFPTSAKKIFGAKDHEAREYLSKIYEMVKTDFNMSGNKLKNGVKTGGEMMSGAAYVEVYMSYKNSDNIGAYLVLKQDSVDSELKAISAHYRTGGSEAGVISEKTIGLESQSEVYKNYSEYLQLVVES